MERTQVMTKRKTIIFIVFSFLTGALTYTNFSDYYSIIAVSFLIVGCITGLTAICNNKIVSIPLIICVACGLAGGGISGGVSSLALCVTGIVVSRLILGKSSMMKIMVAATVGFAASVLISALCLKYFDRINVLGEVFDYIKSGIMDFLKNFFTVMEEEYTQEMLAGYTDAYFSVVKNMFPGIVAVFSLVSSLLSFAVYRIIHKLAGLKEEEKFLFSGLMCDKTTSLVFIICFLCALFMKNGPIMAAFTNIYMILFFVLQICGLSLFDNFMKTRRFHIILRVILLMALLMFSMGLLSVIVLTFSAILDSFKNFRKIGVETQNIQEDENNQ
jgi:hypothetical protein